MFTQNFAIEIDDIALTNRDILIQERSHSSVSFNQAQILTIGFICRF